MCLAKLNTLRTKLGRATTKVNGFRCNEYFQFEVLSDPSFLSSRQRAQDPQLIKQLVAAAAKVLGKPVTLNPNKYLWFVDDANFWYVDVPLAGCDSRLLYFSDLLKGLVYIATSEETYDVYYFSRSAAWVGA